MDKKWKVLWNTANVIDSFTVDSKEEAIIDAINLLGDWIEDFFLEHNILSFLELRDNPDLIDEWDNMIDENYVEVWRYDPDFAATLSRHDLEKFYGTDSNDGWLMDWEPSYEEERGIMWMNFEDIMEVLGE